jgi:hypothetical protein
MATCEVCSTIGQAQKGPGKRVLVGERLVTLCTTHARVVPTLPATGIDELRKVFREGSGNRSLLDRRQELDRRIFPVRPEGRRYGGGRRPNDAK